MAFACEHLASNREGQLRLMALSRVATFALILTVFYLVSANKYGFAYYDYTGAGTRPGLEFPHVFAFSAVLLLPFSLSRLYGEANVWAEAFTSAALSAAVVLSLVRSAYLSLAAVICAFLLTSLTAGLLRVKVMAATVTALLVVMIFDLRHTVLSRFSNLLLILHSGNAAGRAGNGRWALWTTLVRASSHSFRGIALGHGVAFSVAWAEERFHLNLWAQNDFLQFYVVGGVVLFIAYVGLMVWTLISCSRIAFDGKQSSRARAFGIMCIGAWLAYVIFSFTNGAVFYMSSLYFGLLIGLARGMRQTPGRSWLDSGECAPASLG